MVTNRNRIPSVSGLVDASAPAWAQTLVLRLVQFFKLVHPANPTEQFQCTKAQLPPAADWPGCIVLVTDQNCLGVSLGGAWLKLTFGGPV